VFVNDEFGTVVCRNFIDLQSATAVFFLSVLHLVFVTTNRQTPSYGNSPLPNKCFSQCVLNFKSLQLT